MLLRDVQASHPGAQVRRLDSPAVRHTAPSGPALHVKRCAGRHASGGLKAAPSGDSRPGGHKLAVHLARSAPVIKPVEQPPAPQPLTALDLLEYPAPAAQGRPRSPALAGRRQTGGAPQRPRARFSQPAHRPTARERLGAWPRTGSGRGVSAGPIPRRPPRGCWACCGPTPAAAPLYCSAS